jgi:soluble cytochrome b562
MKLDVKIDPVTKEQLISLESMNLLMIQMAEKAVNEAASPFVQKAMDAAGSVNDLLQGLAGKVEELQEIKGTLIATLRDTRFAASREIKEIQTGVADLVSLIDGEQASRNVASLKEFAEVCERLQRLRESGIFDSVLELMLNKEVDA